VSLCGDLEFTYQEGRRRDRAASASRKEPHPWRLLRAIYRANARREVTKRNKLMLELAMETGAVWYLQQVEAV
jgi:hypothetical protein